MNNIFGWDMLCLAVDFASGIFIVIGAFFALVGAIGVVRMPDVFTRMHAASVLETAGSFFLLLGLVLQSSSILMAVKLVFIMVLFMITAPVASYAIAQAALGNGEKPELNDADCENFLPTPPFHGGVETRLKQEGVE